MPKLITTNDKNSIVLPAGNSGYHFSAIRPEKLGATEYTLATVVLDYTGSVSSFATELEQMLKTVLASCKRSPRANNLLVRVILFSSSFKGGTQELHGFKPLEEIDANTYVLPNPSGGTPLRDATYDSATATNAYAKYLYDQDFLVNAIQVVVTDGDDNASATPANKIKTAFSEAVKSERLESNIAILVAINATQCQNELDTFFNGAGFDHFRDVTDATDKEIAKLANKLDSEWKSVSKTVSKNVKKVKKAVRK